MPTVFLSHSTGDRAFVEREIVQLLEQHQVDTWYARDDIQTASHWERMILRGLESCDWFLVVMSPRSELSEWVKDEVDWAMEQRAGRIIPVLMEPCNLRQFHLRMPRIQHVDFHRDAEEGRRKLLKLLERVREVSLDLETEKQHRGPALRELYRAVEGLVQRHNLQDESAGMFSARRGTDTVNQEAIRGALEAFRRLPANEQQRCPALLYTLARLQLAAGHSREALAAFQDVASWVTPPGARAEAHYHAYRAALVQGDWGAALEAFRRAAALDPERWALFPARKYEVEQVLGAGGFGTAFACRHVNTAARVVIKALCPPGLKHDPSEIFAEARVLESLDHPAIIRIRDCDFADASQQKPYLVLERFDGVELDAYVKEHGPLPVEELLPIACQLAEALHAAHRLRILHGDVKPANVLVRRGPDGWSVKLIDFSLAPRLCQAWQSAPGSGPAPGTGLVGGTLGLSAPEQFGEVEQLGPHSDIYSFARLCCFALFRTPQPLRSHWQTVPEALVDLLEPCLALSPQDRPQSFAPLLPQLHRLRQELEGTGKPTAQKPGTPGLLQATQPVLELAEEVWKSWQASRSDLDARRAEIEDLARMDARDLSRTVTQLVKELQGSKGALKEADSISIRAPSEAERKVVHDVLARHAALDEAERQQPEMLNNIGKLQFLAGDLGAAQDTFRQLAEQSADPGVRAEAHQSSYRAALEQRDWPSALEQLKEALRLDARRFAPFPVPRYSPERILGTSEYGVTFLCQDQQAKCQVILKTLDAVSGQPEVDELFAEARVLSGARHPAILQVRGWGFVDEATKSRPYLLFDPFEGLSLRAHVSQQGPLQPMDLIKLAVPAAAALHACHQRGLLHGSIAPDHVLIRKDARGWQVKLADFGFGRLLTRLIQLTVTGTHLTTTGRFWAMNYASPELVQGKQAGPASDVYSFARTCCFALFGNPEPRLRDWRSIPNSLAALLEQCLGSLPRERPASFMEIAQRLNASAADVVAQ